MQLLKIKEKDIIVVDFKCVLDIEIMIVKAIGDFENDNELKWDLDVFKYNVFIDIFYFKWISYGVELMFCGIYGCVSKFIQ